MPWKPGQSGNPKGRARGARSKLSESFIKKVYEDWKEHGMAALETMRQESPRDYIKVIAALMPKDINMEVDITSDLTDLERAKRIEALLDAARTRRDGQPDLGAELDAPDGPADSSTTH